MTVVRGTALDSDLECAALLLLGFEAGIGLRRLLLGMVNKAGRFGAYFVRFALVDALGNNGFGGVFARLELRPLCLLRRVCLLLPDFDVLVARGGILAFPAALCMRCASRTRRGFRRRGQVASHVC
jgi:hypothetical protein